MPRADPPLAGEGGHRELSIRRQDRRAGDPGPEGQDQGGQHPRGQARDDQHADTAQHEEQALRGQPQQVGTTYVVV